MKLDFWHNFKIQIIILHHFLLWNDYWPAVDVEYTHALVLISNPSEKKLKTRILMDFLNFKFGFFQFSNIFFSHFRFFLWKCDSYGIHVIMLFLELLITKKMPEKKLKKYWKLTILQKNYKILHMLKKKSNILSQTQNISFI